MSKPLGLFGFNTRGMREITKRRAIFRHLHKKYPFHIAILEESHSSADIENRWKAEWGGNIFFSHGEKNARGVCILIPRGFSGRVTLLKSEDTGRMVIVRVELNNFALNVVGIYAPTQSDDSQQVQFYRGLNACLASLDELPVVICGDLNLHMSLIDTDNIRYRETLGSKSFREIATDFELVDVWRALNPDTRRFTWRRFHPLRQSRIDYFFISEELMRSQKVTKADIEPGIKSDHSVISLEVELTGNKRGPGLWRFNNSLLENKQITGQIRA